MKLINIIEFLLKRFYKEENLNGLCFYISDSGVEIIKYFSGVSEDNTTISFAPTILSDETKEYNNKLKEFCIKYNS